MFSFFFSLILMSQTYALPGDSYFEEMGDPTSLLPLKEITCLSPLFTQLSIFVFEDFLLGKINDPAYQNDIYYNSLSAAKMLYQVPGIYFYKKGTLGLGGFQIMLNNINEGVVIKGSQLSLLYACQVLHPEEPSPMSGI